ncbi:MAG: hypothetical protein EBY83_03265 [Verrucomicrobia bacterium]|nr:hypothetical protein [Verrucomicrobiota bacterium]
MMGAVMGLVCGSEAESLTANYYQTDPHSYLGKEVKLRVSELVPVPRFTVADPEFVWLEATTGHAKKEEGKIFLRVPKEQSALLSKMVDGSPGRLVTGKFHNQENGAILPEAIAKEVPYYIQVGEKAKSGESDKSLGSMETASGSLMVAPSTKSAGTSVPAPSVAPARPAKAVAVRPEVTGPCLVLCRSAQGRPIEARTAQTAVKKEGVWEVVGMDGKLALLGQGLVVGVLPLASEKDPVAPAGAEIALQKYTEMEKRVPETAVLLAGEKERWEKLSKITVASTPSQEIPQLEEVDTAAGVEESGWNMSPWLYAGVGTAGILMGAWFWRRRVCRSGR